MQLQNKKAFSLIIAVFLMLLTSLLALYLLDYIIPFSKNIKWVENWTKAYYEASKAIEDILFDMRDEDAYYESSKNMPSTSTWYSFSLIATWTTIPIIWNWNSEYDIDYNKISLSNPVQLLLKWAINWDNVSFYFRVPHFDDSSSSPISFSWWSEPIINWQLSSETETLNASWSYIVYDEIDDSNSTPTARNFNWRDWFILSWNIMTFSNFYNDSVNNCSVSWCTLKLSVVNDLKTDDWKKIPYLEYKIDFDWVSVANYYAKITTSWKSTGYKKSLELDIPQQTTIEAFDFTVFQ